MNAAKQMFEKVWQKVNGEKSSKTLGEKKGEKEKKKKRGTGS